MFISNAYAQSIPGVGGVESLISSPIPMLLLMMVVLYFTMIRPQMKRQKEQKAMMEAIGKGDEVVTVGGILGKVVKVNDAYLTVEISDGTEIVMQKAAVTMLLPKGTIKSL